MKSVVFVGLLDLSQCCHKEFFLFRIWVFLVKLPNYLRVNVSHLYTSCKKSYEACHWLILNLGGRVVKSFCNKGKDGLIAWILSVFICFFASMVPWLIELILFKVTSFLSLLQTFCWILCYVLQKCLKPCIFSGNSIIIKSNFQKNLIHVSQSHFPWVHRDIQHTEKFKI